MNYITSCPKCDTQFLLSDEHIKAQRGKVQCGHCEHVFNAKNRLVAVADAPETNENELNEIDAAETIAASDHAQTGDLLGTVESTIAQSISNHTTPFPDTRTEYVPDFEASIASKAVNNQFNEAKPFESTLNSITINDLSADIDFTKPSSKKKVGLILFCCLLLLIGLAQLAFFLRMQIAAYYPELKPLMVQLCDKAGCTIDLPRHLESIVIGESDMQEHEIYQSVINFSTSIVNHARYVQAFPNIELTLTNADDNAVIRKIVLPKEYLDHDVDVNTGIASGEEIHIKLPVYVDHEVVTGYRVQLIY